MITQHITVKRIIASLLVTFFSVFIIMTASLLSRPSVQAGGLHLNDSISILGEAFIDYTASGTDDDGTILVDGEMSHIEIHGIKRSYRSIALMLQHEIDSEAEFYLFYTANEDDINDNYVTGYYDTNNRAVYFSLPTISSHDTLWIEADVDYEIADLQVSSQILSGTNYIKCIQQGIMPFPWGQLFLSTVIIFAEVFISMIYWDTITKRLSSGCQRIFNERKKWLSACTIWLFSLSTAYIAFHVLRRSNLLINADCPNQILLYMLLCGSLIGSLAGISRLSKRFFPVAFFVIGLHVGMVFICLESVCTPMSWDDCTHFFRALLVSYGGDANLTKGEIGICSYGFSNEVGVMAHTYEAQVNDLYKMGIDLSATVDFFEWMGPFVSVFPAIMYPAYLPSGAGIWLARVFGCSLSTMIRAGRAANLLFYLCIMYNAIKTLQRGKCLLTILGLTPIIVFMSSNYSYDPWSISFIVLGTTYVLNAFWNTELKLNNRYLARILLCFGLCCMTKQFYMLFSIICLAIPRNRFISRIQRRQYVCSYFLMSAIILLMFFIPYTTEGRTINDSRGGSTNAIAQLQGIIADPFKYLNLCLSFLFRDYLRPVTVFLQLPIHTAYLGEQAPISESISYIFLLFVLAATVFSIGDTTTGQRTKIIHLRLVAIILFWMSLILIATTLYLSYNPVGSMTFNGVQPRYLLPLLLPLALIFLPSVPCGNKAYRTGEYVVVAAQGVLLMVSLFPLLKLYI